MNKENDILARCGRRDGMTVPEGYFEDFARRMSSTLPANPEAEEPRELGVPRSLWQRVRPFVYMAAMFGGIWCMLKVFSLMRPGDVDLSLDNNTVLTEALGDDNFIYEYVGDDVSAREFYDELYDDSVSVEELGQPAVTAERFDGEAEL